MAVELKVPEVGESITEVEIGKWLKAEGDAVSKDDPIVEIETDKITLELPAPVSGRITKRLKEQGDGATVGEVIGFVEEGEGAAAAAPAAKAEPAAAEQPAKTEAAAAGDSESRVMPAAQRLLDENNLKAADVKATGPGGRLLKEDVQRHLEAPAAPKAAPAAAAAPSGDREEEVVPMTPLRRRIAERLVEAQQNAAMLTTFNEVDMTEVMALRSRYKEGFEKKHGVKLGFMSFFVKATIEALKAIPSVNAEVRGKDIVYKNYYDIGIAIGSGKGLVVPILRNTERMSFADIEKGIGDFATAVKENRLKLEDLQGGTFTITNGGVFGSLLSTPILNPPQSGVLGMHTIQQRPVAVNGKVEIRPMMYLALTYDHRLVDGREAVTFLKTIKEAIEDPARMLMEV